MGICTEKHACETRLPHVNGRGVKNRKYGGQRLVVHQDRVFKQRALGKHALQTIQGSAHTSISLSNMSNILPYAQGIDLLYYCRFMIGHSLVRMGMCMHEHTCEAKLPHINGKW